MQGIETKEFHVKQIHTIRINSTFNFKKSAAERIGQKLLRVKRILEPKELKICPRQVYGAEHSRPTTKQSIVTPRE